MKIRCLQAVVIVSVLSSCGAAEAGDAPLEAELRALQTEWATAKYEAADKKSRNAAFQALLDHAAAFRASHPRAAEAHGWEGIVLSTYAGEVGGMGAMKYAKAAREALRRAESLDPNALDGGIYASLGALYAKVPGGIIGFGDDDLADEYFRKALAVNPEGMDTNFFYGEFLLERGDYDNALGVLERALAAPPDASRPVFDAGRRTEIRALIAEAKAKRGG